MIDGFVQSKKIRSLLKQFAHNHPNMKNDTYLFEAYRLVDDWYREYLNMPPKKHLDWDSHL